MATSNETATYIGDLATSPTIPEDTSTGGRSRGGAEIRKTKAIMKASFPNVTGAVNADQTELNKCNGLTSSTAELNQLDGVDLDVLGLNSNGYIDTFNTDSIDDETSTSIKRGAVGTATGTMPPGAAGGFELITLIGGATAGQQIFFDRDSGDTYTRKYDGTWKTWIKMGAEILDEDDMSSDSDTKIATQQSIKKYIDDRHPSYVRAHYKTGSGVNGASTTSGSWQTYPLSDLSDDPDSLASLASNAVDLPAGKYRVNAFVGFAGDANAIQAQIRIRQTSATAATHARSNQAYQQAGVYNTFNCQLSGRFSLDETETLELQYEVSQSVTNGLGLGAITPSAFGINIEWGYVEFIREDVL